MTWDHHADHDLLTAMMQELQPSQEQLRGVMNRMHAFGYSCTVKAITYCLRNLACFSRHLPFLSICSFPNGSRLANISPPFSSQHLQKLRRKEDKNGGAGKADNGEGASGAVPPKTPGGRKKTATRTPGSAGSKRKNVDAEDDDEEDVKPVKMKKLKEETGVKSEESDT